MTTLHRPETSSPVDFVGPSDADGLWQCMFDMDVLFPADANTTTTLIGSVVARSSRDSGIDSISPSDSPAYRRSSTRSSSPFIATTVASSWPPTTSQHGSVQLDSLRRRTLLGNSDTGCGLVGMPTLKHTRPQGAVDIVDVTTPTQTAPAITPQSRVRSITQIGASLKPATLPADYRTHNNTTDAPMGIRITAVNRDKTSGRMMFTVRVWFENQVG